MTPFDDLKPVKKFTDRNAGVRRIWAAIQRLSPAPVAEAAHTAPEAAHVPGKNRYAKKSAVPAKDAPVAGDDSKKAEVLGLMRRPEGATLNEIMTATGWQAHTVRGFVAGALKKMGLAVESTRREDKERVYRVTA